VLINTLLDANNLVVTPAAVICVWNGTLGPFRLQIFATGDTVALSFVFDKFYLIMD
jgi:hypothetical protein